MSFSQTRNILEKADNFPNLNNLLPLFSEQLQEHNNSLDFPPETQLKAQSMNTHWKHS